MPLRISSQPSSGDRVVVSGFKVDEFCFGIFFSKQALVSEPVIFISPLAGDCAKGVVVRGLQQLGSKVGDGQVIEEYIYIVSVFVGYIDVDIAVCFYVNLKF